MNEKRKTPIQPEVKHSDFDLDVKMLYNGRGFRKLETINPIRCILSDNTELIIPSKVQLDGRSSPRFLHSLFPPYNRALRAWLMHDYMYRVGWGTRKRADIEMFKMSRVLNPGKWYTWAYWDSLLSYWYVRIVGSKVYRNKE